MKAKRILAMLLVTGMMSGVLAGCFRKPVVVSLGNDTTVETQTGAEEDTEEVTAEGAVKTGVSLVTAVSTSEDEENAGVQTAQTDISLVAVTVDDAGVITDCVIDSIQAKINFDETGKVTTPLDTTFVSKNVLGDDYGMKVASSIGKEWNEQVAALADYAVGKTVEELKTTAIDESGMVADVDLASQATLYLGGFVAGIEDAVKNAVHLGAQAGDELSLVSATNIAGSKDASEEGDGQAQAYATIAAVTMKEDVVTSCYIDAVQANVTFDTTGKVTTDVTQPVLSKNQLGDDYGMKVASSIGMDWYQEVAAFCEYVTGKTVTEITEIAVDERTVPTDVDLASSVTIGIGDFQNLIVEAAK